MLNREVIIIILLLIHCDHTSTGSAIVTENPNMTEFKEDILRMFGKRNLPRPEIMNFARDVSSAKDYMLKLYKYTQGETVESINEALLPRKNESISNNITKNVADTVVSFVNNAYIPRPNTTDEDGSMYFDVASNFVIEKTLKSELRLYLDVRKKRSFHNVFRVSIYQIVIPRNRYFPLSSRIINATESSWHEFDVISATKSWTSNSITNNGILVVCEGMSLRDCGIVQVNGEDKYRPFLVSFYQSGDADEFLAEQLPEKNQVRYYVHERLRRSLNELFPRASGGSFPFSKSQVMNNTNCERHPLYIGFKDLGWSNWIIAPEGYKAFYCGGECKFPLHSKMNASNHAIIQTLVHLLLPDNIPEPCCAPIRLDPLQVLFLDEKNNVVMKKYANMIVLDCGCQ